MDIELDALLTRGREAYRRGDLVKAELALTEALDRGAHDYADVHHLLGVVYHSWGLYSKARSAFETALRINPRYAEAALSLSITYNDLGRYTEAQEVLADVVRPSQGGLDPLTRAKIANLHAAVGDAYRSATLPAEAAIEFRRALKLSPQFVDIRLRLAQCLSEAGDAQAAVVELRQALTDNPHYVPALLQLGLLLYGLGDRAGAREALESVLRLKPGHERATTYLRMLEQSARSE
ncbi:MAG: tetratricopeptide repeat protein [Myxococcota bacterium]